MFGFSWGFDVHRCQMNRLWQVVVRAKRWTLWKLGPPVVPASRTTAGPHETTSSPPTGSFSRVQVPGTEQISVFSRSDLAPSSEESEDACRGYLTAIKRNTER